VKVDSQVLVVGAGPVGLALAAELEIAGIHTVVVEQLGEPDTLQKARGVGVLAAEALRRRGLGTQLQTRHQSGRGDYRRDMGSNYAHFAWIHKLDAAIDGEQNRIPALIWQPELERLLTDHATGLGVELLRDHRVTALIHDDMRVRIVIDTPSGQRQFTASFLVGCDGGRSSVRALAGFDFPGFDSTVLGRVARLKLAHRTSFPAPTNNEHGSLQHGGPDDGWVRVRLTERDENTPGANGGDRDSPVTVQEMRDAIQRVTGLEVAITDIQEGRRFRDNSRQAATYRKGRVLLAGDAAHVHSPLGGQGLNLGIMDAVNLGWKLAAVLRGVGDDVLLDSYTRERHPVGAAVLNNTRAQAALLAPTPQVMALREIMSDLMDIPDVKTYFGRMLSGVGVRYPLPNDAGTDHELLGGHVPDFVVDDTTLYAIMSHGRPVLLHTSQAGAIGEAAEPWHDRVHLVSALVLGRSDLSAALIRPDGVLAWAATPFASPDTKCLKTALHAWFGPAQPGADDVA